MPPIVSPPPPPVPIEVISPKGTERSEVVDLTPTLSVNSSPTPATFRSATPPIAPLSRAEGLPLGSSWPNFLDQPPSRPNRLPTDIAVIPAVEQAPFPNLHPVEAPHRGTKPAEHSLPLPGAKRLVSQSRDGEVQEFMLTPAAPGATASPPNAETDATAPATEPVIPPEVVELIADRQEFDSEQQVVTATGNVTMRFANGILLADRLRVNLPDRFAVAEGNVTLKRGQQILQGQRFEYFFVLDKGVIYDANGAIYQPSTARDLTPSLPTDAGNALIPTQTLNERLAVNQPLSNVVGQEGLTTSVGASRPGATSASQATTGGQVNRLRFQAQQVDFDAEGWTAKKVRITNDPFSPPELEVQAETADYYNIAPQVDEVKLSGSRVLLDQKTSLPFQDRLTIDRRDRQPGVLSVGYDGEDRGGLYLQAGFTPIDTNTVRLQVKPQYLLQKVAFPDAFPEANQSDSEVCAFCPAAFGLMTELDANFGDRTSLRNTLNFSNLNLGEIDTSLRAMVALQNKLGTLDNPYDLRLEYNYRERLYNGSLGFQTVNSSVGAILVSPTINLGDPSLQLSYQASIQNVQADTDRPELIDPNSGDTLTTLMRYQGAVALNKFFLLWSGQPLPSEPDKGLRYTPNPVVPYLGLSTGVTGVASYYSDGTTQPSLTGTVGLFGQVGHFSRPYFDYTGFNIAYSQGIRGDASPFLFDRFADTQVLSLGLTQQVYGPLRLGVQSAYSITTNSEISTDYFLEYSRRTYNLQIRYNPQLQVGSLNLRISDFNWNGNPGTFEGSNIRPVIQGVPR
ncbi:MAG: hypothetical protein RLZZ568_2002 [Cyanobacteriota bacterium]